ncbi:Na+/H+ and K+/H+ antiporter [Paenibacillus popilliae ATCC 14706]|uniref:Na+/H+ and K+/H+ antiporter n=2 Tax=Paenibacillus popilliae TaxID=78057 RepID=M9L9Z2_PAEPP|nr:Na+/H+ and K+/H+ antiporter [Paenibacillus popilliae ATCC 14706]
MEFKQQVIQEAKEVGNAAQVARRHNLNAKMLYRMLDEMDMLQPQRRKRIQHPRRLANNREMIDFHMGLSGEGKHAAG